MPAIFESYKPNIATVDATFWQAFRAANTGTFYSTIFPANSSSVHAAVTTAKFTTIDAAFLCAYHAAIFATQFKTIRAAISATNHATFWSTHIIPDNSHDSTVRESY